MSEKIILLDDLKEYDKQMKEAYIEPLKKDIAELERVNQNTTVQIITWEDYD
jgi:hypothetical protein